MPPCKRIVSASRALAEYEDANRDLPKDLRVVMALFALSYRVPLKDLEELFERPIGSTPRRHRAWLWWEAMRTSGLGSLWGAFADERNSGQGMRSAVKILRDNSTPEEYETLGRRLGYGRDVGVDPKRWKDCGPSMSLWSKGGCWYRTSPFTKIIWFGEHLDRDYSYNTLTEALGPEGARELEYELSRFINPNDHLHPEAINLAVSHVRTRIPLIAGWSIPTASMLTAAWFFQTKVPDPHLPRFYSMDKKALYAQTRIRHGRRVDWRWIPDE